ncbi:MAG: Lar family restriction alleviation protein [Armatimonadetes bacterium]|nr:Lar family restriction alleviation protein [Armatimonadota bacterium]
MIEAAKLKPCPFCGRELPFLSHYDEGYWLVQCTQCFAKTLRCPTEESAADAWNRRADSEQEEMPDD